MNKGAFVIIGIGVFLLICGYISESDGLMAVAGFVILAGFCLLAAKSTTAKNPKTGNPYYRCPNCNGIAGEEIPQNKREDGKTYKCKVCGYKW